MRNLVYLPRTPMLGSGSRGIAGLGAVSFDPLDVHGLSGGVGFSAAGLLTGGAADLFGGSGGGSGKGGSSTPTKAQIAAGVTKLQIKEDTKLAIALANSQAAQANAAAYQAAAESRGFFANADGSTNWVKVAIVGGAGVAGLVVLTSLMRRRA